MDPKARNRRSVHTEVGDSRNRAQLSPAQQQSGVPANIVVNQTAQQNLNGTPLQYPGDNSAVQLPTTPLYGFGIGLTYGVTDAQGNAVPTKNLTMEESVVLKSATPPEASVVASGLSQTTGTIPFAVNGKAYDQVGPMSAQKGITEKLAGFPKFSLTLQQTLTVHGPGAHSLSTTRLITLTNTTITDAAQ